MSLREIINSTYLLVALDNYKINWDVFTKIEERKLFTEWELDAELPDDVCNRIIAMIDSCKEVRNETN